MRTATSNAARWRSAPADAPCHDLGRQRDGQLHHASTGKIACSASLCGREALDVTDIDATRQVLVLGRISATAGIDAANAI
ncbi:MAG: hypothetical protein ACLR0N_05630 [Bilophila wadsworthia]